MMPGALMGLELGKAPGKGPTLHSFTPTTPSFAHTNLVAWLDASDSLTIDGSSRVSSWLDKWTGNSATQATAANRPFTNSVNGHQCVYFPDGYTNNLDASYITGLAMNNRDPWMMSFVWNLGRLDINQFAVSVLGTSGVFAGMIGPNIYGERANGGTVDSVSSNQGGGPMVYGLCYDGTNLRLRHNGGECAAAASSTTAGQTLLWIGGDPRSGGTRYIFANFCELVVYNTYDLTQLGSFESYAATKWDAVH